MARTKKAAKLAKNKKFKKKPLDSTPWEELSKNIKGKFKSKIQTQNAQENRKESLDFEDCVNSNWVNPLNFQEASSSQSNDKEKVKIKTEINSSFESINTKVKHDNKSHDSNYSTKDLSMKNNDCDSHNINDQNLLLVKQLPKWQKKKLTKQKLSSPISTEKSDVPTQSKAKKLKLEKNKLFEQRRLERRKELGIMLLPKKIENRLLRIRKALRKKNLPPAEIKSIMRKERSKAQDEFRKTQSNQV